MTIENEGDLQPNEGGEEDTEDEFGENPEEPKETPEVSPEEFSKIKEVAKNQKIRAEKAEKELAALKPKLTPKEEKKEVPDEWRDKVDFLIENPSTKEDIDIISAFAKKEGVSLKEASQFDKVKEFISLRREKAEKDKKVPEPSSLGVPSPKEVSSMKEDEFQKMEETELQKHRDKRGV